MVTPSLPSLDERLQTELRQFSDMWKGGYYEGDPLDPMSPSSYESLGYMSVLHATYLCCIRPYVGPATNVIEIGPGRGAWTKTFVERGAREIWCLDALSREYNGFDDYVGRADNIHYFQVDDFLCRSLPDDHFDYLFSFGCFCHLSPMAIEEYLRNLRPKLRSGAHAFVLVADYDKYNRALGDGRLLVDRAIMMTPRNAIRRVWNRLARAALRRKYPQTEWWERDKGESMEPKPGRFYHAGARETAALLSALGYEVLDDDIGTIPRDPILHFRKP